MKLMLASTSKRNETKRNEMKRNETKRNETKQNKRKTKQNKQLKKKLYGEDSWKAISTYVHNSLLEPMISFFFFPFFLSFFIFHIGRAIFLLICLYGRYCVMSKDLVLRQFLTGYFIFQILFKKCKCIYFLQLFALLCFVLLFQI